MVEQIKVGSFEELVIFEVLGGAVTVSYGSHHLTHTEPQASREPVTVVMIDYDVTPEFEPYKQIVHAETGETLGHYLQTCQGCEEDQRLEPETEWEWQESNN